MGFAMGRSTGHGEITAGQITCRHGLLPQMNVDVRIVAQTDADRNEKKPAFRPNFQPSMIRDHLVAGEPVEALSGWPVPPMLAQRLYPH
jgi:hypothetical protein